MAELREAEYHSRDFDWEDLRRTVESNPVYRYHFDSQTTSSPYTLAAGDGTDADADAWRRFHRRHSAGKFFKERRYLLKEFPELSSCNSFAKVLEVGCGSGSTALPILRSREDIVLYACDCSSDVLEKAQEILATSNVCTLKNRFHPFAVDFSREGFPNWLLCRSCQKIETGLEDEKRTFMACNELSFVGGSKCCIGGVDFVTLVFTLSAVPFRRMPFVISECISVLKPGGLLLFRDYGVYDMTMLRFPREQKIGFREYIRCDGTLSYFFSLDTVRSIFLGAGFLEVELEYCCVKSTNRRTGKKMERVWVHGKFQKPV